MSIFPLVEVYVKCFPTGGARPARYNYAYNLTDHLGNIRLTYGMDKDLGKIVILEENHYYPFGMKHEKYNSDKYEYVEISKEDGGYIIGIEPLGPQQRRSYQYKYQGQERQDELGLNWDSFKWRNYDYAIGRFMSVDPLAEKYSYQSPYNFAENKVISHRELEGLEGAWFQAVWNAHAYAKPNGVPAHVNGVASGLYNSAKGLVNAVTHPVSTAKGIVNMAVAGAVGNNPVSMLRVDNAIGTNSFGTSQAVSKSIDKGVSNLVSGNGQQRGEVIGEIAGAVIGAKGMGMVTEALSTAGKTTSLFRAVSTAELTDIASNGLRTTSGGYETLKLFATSAQDAAQFGKLNYSFDGIPNTIIEAKVPTSVMGTVTNFTADGMSAIAIPAEQLQNIKKVIPSNSSPIGN